MAAKTAAKTAAIAGWRGVGEAWRHRGRRQAAGRPRRGRRRERWKRRTLSACLAHPAARGIVKGGGQEKSGRESSRQASSAHR